MKSFLHHVAVASGLALGIVPATPGLQAATPPANEPLRVCADSNYMPYSDRDGQGFENKVAAVVAQALGRKSNTIGQVIADKAASPISWRRIWMPANATW